MFYITLKVESDTAVGEIVRAITRACDSGEISEPFGMKTEEQDFPKELTSDGFYLIDP